MEEAGGRREKETGRAEDVSYAGCVSVLVEICLCY